MQTDAFAEAVGKHLDRWLSMQAPLRKASAESTETLLQTLGVPSRNQVVGIARQLMEFDDRLEDIENQLKALTARSSAAGPSGKKPGAAQRRQRRKRAARS